jgi:hypothetical protein
MSIREASCLIQVSNTEPPKSIDGEPLDPNCMHCHLALPVQHFMDKHPEKSREDIVKEACEMLAELVASCGGWDVVLTYQESVMDYLPQIIRSKWESYQEYLHRGA